MTVRASSIALLAALAAAAPAAASGPPAAAAATRMCQNTYGGDVIRATSVGCRLARRIVRTWGRRYKADGRVNRRVIGFECRGRNNPVEGLVVTCRREGARISFYANVP